MTSECCAHSDASARLFFAVNKHSAKLVENKFQLQGNQATVQNGIATFDQLQVLRVGVGDGRDMIDCDQEQITALGVGYCPEVKFGEQMSFKVDCNFDNKDDLPIPTLEHNNTEYEVRVQALRARISDRTNNTDIATPIVDPGFSVVVEKCTDDSSSGLENCNDWTPLLSDASCKATIETDGAAIGGTADKTYGPREGGDRRAFFNDLVIRSTVTQNDMEAAHFPQGDPRRGQPIFTKAFRGHAQVNVYLPLIPTFALANLFPGVGSTVKLRFSCSNAMKGGALEPETAVKLNECGDGKEPNAQRSACADCPENFFSNALTRGGYQRRALDPPIYADNKYYHPELCQPCPGTPADEENNNLASSTTSRTSCECNFGYFAVIDSPEYRRLGCHVPPTSSAASKP